MDKTFMSKNAKSQLLEFLKDLGYSEKLAVFKTSSQLRSGVFHSTVNIVLPGDCEIYGAGEGHRRPEAESAAAQVALKQLHSNYPDLFVDWTRIKVEAQAGDALIKLGVYLSLGCNSASSSS
jgi:dsRNA-specific ribonuclease